MMVKNNLIDDEFKKEVLKRLEVIDKRIIIAISTIKVASNPDNFQIAMEEFSKVMDITK